MHTYGYQYQFQFDESGNSVGVGNVTVTNAPQIPTTGTASASSAGGVPISPTLPDHIYVRQEGSPQRAEIYDATTGKHVTNVTDVEVTLNRRESRVRVTATDGERTYPVQDLTVDASDE